MLQRLLLLALCLMGSGCASTRLAPVPVEIPPAPAVLTSPCLSPVDLPAGASARDLVDALMEWMQYAGCERSKRAALVEAWPK